MDSKCPLTFRPRLAAIWARRRAPRNPSPIPTKLGTWEAQRQAYARFYAMVLSQAQALAYIDAFWWLTLGAALMFGLAFVLKRNDPRESGTVSVH